MKKKNIVIIGPIAPPFGGVSIHILRLSKLLENEYDLDFIDESRVRKIEYFNFRSLNLIAYLKKIRHADLLFIHSGKNSLRFFHLCIGKIFLKKVIVTIHSFTGKKSKISKYIYSTLLKMADKVVLVNSDLMKRLPLPPEKCIIKEAFIPPIIEEEPDLPKVVSEWFLNKKNDDLIICANASRLDTFNNQDIYGLDLCIEVANRLLKKNFPVKFIFVVGSVDKNHDRFLNYQALIKDLDLDKSFFLINEKLSFVRVIMQSNIVLRPTNTDGDALTIREGLYYGKPVLASDVVKRPNNVFLFHNRDADDLELQLITLIQLIQNKEPSLQQNIVSTDNLNFFYSQLIRNTLANRIWNE